MTVPQGADTNSPRPGPPHSARRGDVSGLLGRLRSASRRPGPRLALLATLLVLAALTAGWLGGSVDVAEVMTATREVSPPSAIAVIALLAVLIFPRAVLAAASGALFGGAVGAAYALAGTVLGAVLAFGVGRLLGRSLVAQLLGRGRARRLRQLHAWVARRGLRAVICARLVPVLPFGLINYAMGAMQVRVVTFAAGTAVGTLPTTVLYAVAGASLRTPTVASLVTLGCVQLLAGLAAVWLPGRARGRTSRASRRWRWTCGQPRSSICPRPSRTSA